MRVLSCAIVSLLLVAGTTAGSPHRASAGTAGAPAPATTQPRVPLSVDELVDDQLLPLGSAKLRWFPDSRRLLVELPQRDFTAGLYVLDTRTGSMRGIGSGYDAAPSPDGESVGYLGDDGQVWLTAAEGGDPRRVTDADRPVWGFSFAGARAVVYTTVAATPPDPLPPGHPDATVTRVGAYPTPHTHFDLQPLDGGQPRRLGSEDGYVFGAMSHVPSRQEVVYPHDSDLRTDATMPAEVHAISTRTGRIRTVVRDTGGQWLIPTVLPDGKRVAFPMAAVNTGYPTYQDVGLAPLDGGAPRRLTDGPMQLGDAMAAISGDRVAFRCKDSTYTRICVTGTDADSAPARTLVARPGRDVMVLAGSPDGDRLAWITGDGYGRTALEVAPVADPGAVTTRPLPGQPDPGVPLGAVREVAWRSDGLRLTGLLITPPDYRPGIRYPVVVDLHGGPAGGVSVRYGGSLLTSGPMEWQLWASRGYAVFVPDYRESGMYGWDPIADARGKDFLARDVDDVMRGIDMLDDRGVIDPDRMALVGHSYGALLGNYLLTRVQRFRAAVLHEGIADIWLANSVQSPGKGWAEWQQGGPPWDSRAQRAYLRNEALLSAGSYRTPTLFTAGEYALGSDTLNYSWKYMYTSLHRRGIDTEFLIYGGEGHVFLNPANQKDSLLRSLRWITDRVPAGSAEAPHRASGATRPAAADADHPGTCAALREFALTAPGGQPWPGWRPCPSPGWG